jgi:hypothetical protein
LSPDPRAVWGDWSASHTQFTPGWEITINGAAIPLWGSWLAAAVAVALAVVGLTAS